MTNPTTNLIWLDLEMTGLDPTHDVILDVACVATDARLTLLQEGPSLQIHQPDIVLDSMDPVVKAMHTKSGLLHLVKQSSVSVEQAEKELITFVKRHAVSGQMVLCGNTIAMDRSFLKQYMPEFESLFHYRMIDVTTVKLLAQRWYPSIPVFKKEERHTALADVYESIAELTYYKKHLFK